LIIGKPAFIAAHRRPSGRIEDENREGFGRMPIQIVRLMAAMACFVGAHFVLSHPLRAPAVATLGDRGFRIVYALVAAILLALALAAFRYSPHDPLLWTSGRTVTNIVYDVLTYGSLVLFSSSLFGNPASNVKHREFLLQDAPRGVFRMTRHPMMFAFILWSGAEILLVPAARQLILFGGVIILALVGASLQDRKLTSLVGSDWQTWMDRTPFWPDLRRLSAPGINWLIALIPWLALTWIHSHIWQSPVGIWLLDPAVQG